VVWLQEEDMYDISEQLVNDAVNDHKLHDTFPEILHDSLPYQSVPD